MKRRISTLKKRWLKVGLLSLLALVGGLFYALRPVQALTPISSLKINGNTFDSTALATNPNGTGWEYDHATSKLTLNGLSSDWSIEVSGGLGAELTLKLIGNNSATKFIDISTGVAVKVEGPGKLSIDQVGAYTDSLFVAGNLTMNSGTLRLKNRLNGADATATHALLRVARELHVLGSSNLIVDGESNISYGSAIKVLYESQNSFKTSGNISAKMTAPAGTPANVIDKIYAIHWNSVSTKAVIGGTGTYVFEAPVNAFGFFGKAPESHIAIVEPTGAHFNVVGAIVDDEGNSISPIAKIILSGDPTTYNTTINPSISNGTVTASPNSAIAGTAITLTISPNGGHQLKAGSLKAYETGNTSNTVTIVGNQFTMPAHNVTVTAEFEPIPITVTGITIQNPPATIEYNAGEVLDLTGLVVTLSKSNSTSENIALADFSANDLSTNPANGATLATTNTAVTITHGASSLSVDQNITVNPAHTVTVNCGTNGTCGGGGIYTEGATATVYAVADDGYLIDKWKVNGTENSALSGVQNGNGGFFVIANTVVDISFKRDPAKAFLTLSCGAGGGCSIDPNEIVHNIGSEVTLTLTPNSGKKVASVSNATKVSNTEYTITMDADKTVAVVFVDIPTYDLTIDCGIGGTCTPDHANPYDEGDTALITITPDLRKQIKSVTGATKVDDTTYKVVMDAAKTVTVEFEDAPVSLVTDKPILKQNEELKVTIKNLAAIYEGETVEFWLNSDPIKLGEATVLYGSATVTALVPCGVQPGDHTVTARINGVNVGTPVTVTVLSSPACPAASPNTGIGRNLVTILTVAVVVILIGASGLLKFKQQG